MSGVGVGAFLPGELVTERGTVADYRALARFHYLAGAPATWAGVWVVRYVGGEGWDGTCGEWVGGGGVRNRDSTELVEAEREGTGDGRSGARELRRGRVVAVAVLSWPAVNSIARDAALGVSGWERGRRLRFVNEHVRTISRVIVHPQFRGVGVASGLVRRVCDVCPTRWVEAFAVMGRVNPFFEKGGMRAFGAGGDGGPAYYLREKGGRGWREEARVGTSAEADPTFE